MTTADIPITAATEPCFCGGQLEFWYEAFEDDRPDRQNATCDVCKFEWTEGPQSPTLKQAQRVAKAEQRVARVRDDWWQRLGWGTNSEVADARVKLVSAQLELARAEKAARKNKPTPL